MKAILTSAVFLFTMLGGAAAGAATSAAEQVERYLQAEMRARQIPGLQVVVVQGGNIVLSKSYGLAELPHALAVTPDSVFSINSATKAFTGVAIMQLAEQGKVDLSAPVSRYLQDLPPAWQAVTVAQLLNHSSGLPDIVAQQTWQVASAGNWDAAWRQAQATPMDFAPGARFRYNQSNYLLLGKIIDQLSGQPFTQFIRQRQFDVAGMRHTSFGDMQDVVIGKAPSYRLDADGKTYKVMVDDFPPFLRAGAGINTTADNLARWIIALQQGRLLSPSSLRTLWQPGRLADGRAAPWAQGWPVIRDREYRTVAGIGGARSAFYIYPEHDLAVIILTNLAGAAPEQMLDIVASHYLPGLKKISGSYAIHRLREQTQAAGFERLERQLALLRIESGIAQPEESDLNAWGYRLLGAGQTGPAIAVLGLTAGLYPQSANAHDSLAEAYQAAGESDLAEQHYRRAKDLARK